MYSNYNVCANRYQSSTTKDLLDTIMSIQPKDSGGDEGGESREASVARQTKEMLSKLPKDYDPYEVKARYYRPQDPINMTECITTN